MEMIDIASRLVAGMAFPAFIAVYLMIKMESTLIKLTCAINTMTEICRDCKERFHA